MGVILPFILSLFGIMLFGKYEAIWTFLDQGQFLLFGAGLYTSSIFLFQENKKSVRQTKDKVLSIASVWLLIFCSGLYATIYSYGLLDNVSDTMNAIFIRITSVIFFIISLVSVYRSLFIDFLKVYPDVDIKDESKKGVDNILKQL
jgi:hypothetical protein